MVTLKQVAERAGVSRAAVSRAYTKGASVSPKTRAKIEEAAAALGYSPNILARSLTTGQTQLIGLVSNNFHNPAFLQIFDLFTRGLQDRGLRPLLVNLTDETDPARSVQLLRSYSVDGVVLASSELPAGFAAAFAQAGLPVVHAFGRSGTDSAINVVCIDNIHAGRLAAATLIARGYRHIGFMGGPEAASTTQDRLAGFVAQAQATPGIRVSHSFAGAYSFEAGQREMARLLRGDPAEAYFCGDDVLSIGALSAAADAGRRVPDDLGVIGLNDMEMAAWGRIDLTTIHQPFRDIVAASVDLMMAALCDPDRAPETRILPCHVVERGTLRPLP
ncbi:MAG: LacI family DNA-binding transcriptional regulator [Pseudomonadota bacterium]